eukprot:NODE_375_length_894_cov_294.357236_g367_i0.p1 GENE.NODE_375_length_894_cov_294.357236_g367_i0~~NODE_375_length_894_cov_294.357236_g367_i0.p1  ORF type:complete len:159 (+),score=26.65 NODE_375_length_894_cov_294.357236_g367_i0:88-564(+)
MQWEVLPCDVLSDILCFISTEERYSCFLVCKKMYSLLDYVGYTLIHNAEPIVQQRPHQAKLYCTRVSIFGPITPSELSHLCDIIKANAPRLPQIKKLQLIVQDVFECSLKTPKQVSDCCAMLHGGDRYHGVIQLAGPYQISLQEFFSAGRTSWADDEG